MFPLQINSSVQSISHVRLFVTPWTAACQASRSITNSRSLLKHTHWVSDAIQPSYPLSSPSPPAFNLFPASGSFPMSQFFASGGQSIGVSASAPVLPMNIQDWFPLGWTGLISLPSKGLSRVFSSTTVQKHQFFSTQLSLCPILTSIYDYWKNHSFDYMAFVDKVMSLLFSMLSGLVIAFLPRSMCLLISGLQSPSAVILELTKVSHCFHYLPICLPWSDGNRCHDVEF